MKFFKHGKTVIMISMPPFEADKYEE